MLGFGRVRVEHKLKETALNFLLKNGLITKNFHKMTGRISQAADASYTEASIFEKEMSDSLCGDQMHQCQR